MRLQGCLAIALLWVLYEILRSVLFTGFPILDAGYSFLDTPVEGLATVLSVKGVSFVAAFVSAALISGWVSISVACVLVFCSSLIGWVEFTQRLEPHRIGIVQADIPLTEKFEMAQTGESYGIYSGLTHELEPKDLVVWSEAVFATNQVRMREVLERIRSTAGHEAIAAGYIEYADDTRYNSLLISGEEFDNYRKNRLVPFGEFVPLRPVVEQFGGIDVPHSDLSASDSGNRSLESNQLKLAPAICYEASFEMDVTDAVRESDADAVLVVSEDAWFGNSLAPHQNFQMARMRALEHGRYVIRAANSGISGIVGPDGKVVAQAPQFERTVLEAEVYTMQGSTPFTHLGRFLYLIVLLAFLATTVLSRARPVSRDVR